MPWLAPVMMITLFAMDSSGVDGSIEGYWSRETCFVNCMLLRKKSAGRDSIFKGAFFSFFFLLEDLDRKTRIRITSLETVMAQSTRLKEGKRRVDDFERSSMFSLHEESWNTLYPIVIY